MLPSVADVPEMRVHDGAVSPLAVGMCQEPRMVVCPPRNSDSAV